MEEQYDYGRGIAQGKALIKSKNHTDAIVLYSRILQNSDIDNQIKYDCLIQRSACHIFDGKIDSAIEDAESAIALRPESEKVNAYTS